MKILIINSFYYPNMVGGTENSVKLLAEELSKNNEVFVFTIDNLKKGVTKEVQNDVTIIRCDGGKFNTKVRLSKKGNIIHKIKNKLVELHNSYVYKNLLNILEEIKPDIVHTNNLYGLSPLVWKAIKKKNIKLVHTIRDYWMLDPSVENKNRKNIFIHLYQSFFRNKSKYVDYVTAPSKYTLNAFIKKRYFLNASNKVVVNSVKIDYFLLNSILEKRNQDNRRNINFIYVGMLEEKKGILNLLSVFSKIDNSNIRLTICGNGSLEKKVQDYCKKDNRIQYLGQLYKEELKKVWLQNDVCIVPSIWDEPFGRVVIEANQFGLPVIGSNKGGIFEILSTIHTGELFQYDDLEDLEKKMISFSNRQNIKKYYNNILNNISFYSLESQINNFYSIYNELIKKN